MPVPGTYNTHKGSNMKRAIILFCLIYFVSAGQSQSLVFENVYKLTGWRGGRIKSCSNNQYVTGYYRNVAYFNTDTLTFSNYPYGLYLVKYNINHNEEWVKNYDLCQYYQREHSIDIDNNGNIYLATHFAGQAIMDDTTYGTPSACDDNTDFFINKYSKNGDLIWGLNCGGSSRDRVYGLKIDSQGNVIVVGNISSNGTINGQIINPVVSHRLFVTKLDSNGQYLWSELIGVNNYNQALMALDVDIYGNSYVASAFISTFAIGPVNISTQNNRNSYVLKFDTAGNLVWHQEFYCDDVLDIKDIKAYPTHIYLIGDYKGNFSSDIGALSNTSNLNNLLIAIDGTTGNVNWVKEMGGPKDDRISEIDGDSYANLFIAGETEGLFSIDNIQYTGSGFHFMLIGLDYTGNVIDVLENDVVTGYYINSTSVEVSNSNKIFLTGEYHGTGNIDTTNFSFGDDHDLFMTSVNADSLYQNSEDSLSVTADPLTGCDSLSVNFKGQSNKPIVGFEWHLGDTIINTKDDSIHHTYSIPGSYVVKIITTDISGTIDSVFLIDTIKVFDSYFTQLPPININTGDSSLIFGNYQDSSGFYYDSLYSINGCDSIVEQQLIVSNIGIDELSNKHDIYIYPNPANHRLQIVLPKNSEYSQIDIIDFKGRLIKSQKIEGDINTSMDMENLEKGVYFFHCRGKYGNTVLKLIKTE